MANHQDDRYKRPQPIQRVLSSSAPRSSSNALMTDDDDLVVDVDEPPDNHIRFGRIPTTHVGDFQVTEGYFRSPTSHNDRKESLLTKALLTNPEFKTKTTPLNSPISRTTSTASTYSTTSATSIAELSSDGGFTSPARTDTPSPPIPSMNHVGLTITTPKGILDLVSRMDSNEPDAPDVKQKNIIAAGNNDDDTKTGAGRKRCITFACGPDAKKSGNFMPNAKVGAVVHSAQTQSTDAPKRPCMLRFACPSKPSTEGVGKVINDGNLLQHRLTLNKPPVPPAANLNNSKNPDLHSIMEIKSSAKTDLPNFQTEKPSLPSRSKYKPEGVRFHEFASQYEEEDEWLYEQPISRHKITVNDTLRKENAIRQIGKEAEEEALEEENAEEEADLDLDDDDDDDREDSDNYTSDGGNETDDEEGFADSDEESDVASDYQFWTPRNGTAATSTEQLELVKSRTKRTASVSSNESTGDVNAIRFTRSVSHGRRPRKPRPMPSPKMRPGTPDLPDSTDFVCGTLDEDRVLEAAYISCMQQRRKAKHHPVPQDFDPSFPTSDLDEEDEYENELAETSDEPLWVIGRPDDSEVDKERGRKQSNSKLRAKATTFSPRRLRSPPPQKVVGRRRSPPPPKHRSNHRSPPPRRIFGGYSPSRLRSPPPPHFRDLGTPPSSRRPSVSKVSQVEALIIRSPYLGERPNLTYTKSLPKTPNPFWHEHCKSEKSYGKLVEGDGEMHSRGPIDIVQGLENKRQRRKEKFWRQHCRHAGKEKERRCQPGKGAQRMRELGLEMAGKSKAYGPRAQLVLSV